MIKLEISEPKSVKWKKWRADSERRTRSDVKKYRPGNKIDITNLYKREKKFFTDSSGPFKGKCAFCESSVSNHYGDVEHYRPKSGVQDENRKWIHIKIGSKRARHPGYFWLAYDWTNLIPSCAGCNRFQAGVGKGSCFPVVGRHAERPGEEKTEEPLLLNPRVDDPQQHFEFDDNWLAKPITERGRVTIDILGLNSRDLPKHRTDAAKDTEKAIMYELAHLDYHTRATLNAVFKMIVSDDHFHLAVRRIVSADYYERLRGIFD